MRIITCILVLILLSITARSQYLQVTHTTGTTIVGGNAITAIPSTPIFTSTTCSFGPYGILPTTGSYTFVFSYPVSTVRMRFSPMHNGETIRFHIDGTKYNITAANISPNIGNCSSSSVLYVPVAIGGDLIDTLGPTAGSPWANGQVDISTTPFSTIQISHIAGPNGTAFDFFFVADTAVYIPIPFADSALCAGDTLHIPYGKYGTFIPGNVFTFQLSDASGSFSSPTTLGTVTDTAGGVFKYVITSSTPSGSGFRVRVVSSLPSRISNNNGKNILIGNTIPAKPVITVATPVCTGDTLKLSAGTTTSGVTWQWTGPNSFTSTQQNPVILNPSAVNAGNYFVTAKLYACNARDTETVSVFNQGWANITSPSAVCINDTLFLNASVQYTTNNYSWTGPLGFSSTAKDTFIANVTGGMAGNYIFKSNNTGCFARDTVNVVVFPKAAGRVVGSNSPVCAGDSLKLNASSTTSGVGYTWTGPNGFISAQANPAIPNVALVAGGNYVVNFSVNGCSVKDTIAVVINSSPVTPIASSNSAICEHDTLRLYSTNSSSGVTWNWTGPNSFTSAVQNPILSSSTLSANGDYIVTATLSNGCARKDTITIQVKPLPANFNATSNSPVCTGNTLFLSGNTSSTGVSFSWTGPNSFSSSLQNPNITSVSTSANGNYIVTATLNGCILKDTAVAVVNLTPSAPVIGANTPVCVGQDLKLTASTIAGANYNWSGPGSYSSTSQNPIRTATTFSYAGNYSVTATLNNCISSPATINVGVINAPNITMYPSPKDSICQGATVNFISSATTPGSSPVYRWYKNNTPIFGASATNYSTSTATDLDEYFCTLNVTGVCAEPYTDSSNKITMHVLPWLVPSVTISQTPTGTLPSGTLITFNANPANGGKIPKYQWKRNSANVVGALSNTWGAPNLSNKDIICVEMTSTYMCPNPSKVMSNCMEVSIQTVSIEGINWQNNPPRIYPNPTKDKLIIEGITKGTEIKLTDVLGRMVVHMTAKQAIEIISTISLVPGTYMLQLHNEAANYMVVKIVKE